MLLYGDYFYCAEFDVEKTESQIKRPNKCSEYIKSTLGDVITGKEYKPRGTYNKGVKGQIELGI